MKYTKFLLILIIYSCTNQRILYDNYDNNSLELKLKSDSTFLFLCNGCMSWDSISGVWKTDKKRLVLNSFITKKDTRSFNESIKCDTCINGIYVKTIDYISKYGLELSLITVFKEGKPVFKYKTDNDGNVIINDENIDSLKVEYVGFSSRTFVPDKSRNTLNVVNMKPEELNRKVIENEIWKIKNGYIVSPEGFKLIKTNENEDN